jgi:vacuolar-type H+-ATPase subunit E/Vma4
VPDPEDRLLLAEIQAQAEAEREKILADGRTRAAAVHAKADEEIHRLEAEESRRIERGLAADEERFQGEARLAAAARVLGAKRRWVARAFESARRRLAELLSTTAYASMLKGLIGEAAAAAATGCGADGVGGADGVDGAPCELLVCEADVELARRLASELGLPHALRAQGTQPGTVIALSPGRRIDNSLATRLAEAERLLEQDVARLLFGGPNT